VLRRRPAVDAGTALSLEMSFVKRKLAALVHRRVSGWNLLAIRCLAIGDTHVNETLRRDLKLNYDLQHLQSLTQEQLIYK